MLACLQRRFNPARGFGAPGRNLAVARRRMRPGRRCHAEVLQLPAHLGRSAKGSSGQRRPFFFLSMSLLAHAMTRRRERSYLGHSLPYPAHPTDCPGEKAAPGKRSQQSQRQRQCGPDRIKLGLGPSGRLSQLNGIRRHACISICNCGGAHCLRTPPRAALPDEAASKPNGMIPPIYCQANMLTLRQYPCHGG